MPRQKRADEAGSIYHALNRGNARQTIFYKPDDYEAFLHVLAEGLERYPVELFSFTLMPNHWHMVLRPAEDGGMGRMLRWVTATHTLSPWPIARTPNWIERIKQPPSNHVVATSRMGIDYSGSRDAERRTRRVQ
jgi:REP element-mobilizing transposase RayT